MSLTRSLAAGLVLGLLTAPGCTPDDAATLRARAEQAEARAEGLGADLAEAEIALTEARAALEVATAAVGQLEEHTAALQADLREKDLLLTGRSRDLTALQEEHQDLITEWEALYETYAILEAHSTLECPLPTGGLPVQSLPRAVAATRSRIHAAAVACDWLELHRLADEAGGISYADGAVGWHGDPVPYWLANPDDLRLIAGVLEMSFSVWEGQDENGDPLTLYVWPAVASDDHRTEADWAELRRVYSDEYIAQIRDLGEGYAGGLVVAIRADGAWVSAQVVSV